MTRDELKSLRHPSEGSRFWVTLIVIVPVLIAAVVLTLISFGGLILPILLIIFMLWIVTRLASAQFLGNAVLISPDNFPEIATMLAESKELFEYKGQIDAYIYEEGTYNALLLPLLRRKLLLLNSEVVATTESQNEIRWIVARFVGSLASKHYRFFWLQAVVGSIERIMIFNLLMYPYERAVVKSGDQLGLFAIDGDIDSALRSVQKFMAGGPLGGRVNLKGVLHQQAAIEGSFFAWLAKCLSPFPHSTARVVNLLRFSGERYPEQLRALIAKTDDGTLPLLQHATGWTGDDRAAEQTRIEQA